MEKSNKVAFRRIRGRIVPIKQKNYSGGKDAGLIAGGIASSILGSGIAVRAGNAESAFKRVARVKTLRSRMAFQSKGLIGGMTSFTALKQRHEAIGMVKKANILKSIKIPAVLTGITVGGTLAYMGIRNMYKGKTGKELESTDTGIYAASLIPSGAALLASSWYLKRKGFSLGTSLTRSPRMARALLKKK